MLFPKLHVGSTFLLLILISFNETILNKLQFTLNSFSDLIAIENYMSQLHSMWSVSVNRDVLSSTYQLIAM